MRLGYASRQEAIEAVRRWRAEGLCVVFTNGCFDLIHAGHVRYLQYARAQGDRLVVGINDDDSVRRLKGDARPIQPLADRATVLSAIRFVDLVVPFAEDTPLALIQALSPDVLVKGGDYREDEVVGADWVKARGGKVVIAPFWEGRSTSAIIERIRAR